MLEVRPLTVDDLNAARELSTQVGWNQISADWERFLTLCPRGCFAGIVDDEVVATTAVITYGDDVSWIGMVLVDEHYRGRGYGSQIFERGLDHAVNEGTDVIGLDATHLGEPIYRKYGFERVEPVFRWQGMLRPAEYATEARNSSKRIERVSMEDVDPLCDFDRERTGVDRSALLRELFGEPDVRGYLARESAAIVGYTIIRPGRTSWQIGPIVAAQPETIDPLLDVVTVDFEGRNAIVDVPERTAISSSLETFGLSRERELVRMTYPEPTSVLTTGSVRSFLDFGFG